MYVHVYGRLDEAVGIFLDKNPFSNQICITSPKLNVYVEVAKIVYNMEPKT